MLSKNSAPVVRIGEAAYPLPFPSQLEFNAPVHGVWNIVHMGMLIPDSHQIYVCAPNCMRGVVLTAAEMGALDRFSQVLLEEKDILTGRVEQATIEGTAEVLNRLPHLPKVVMLFTVCVHHFIGTDLRHIYEVLEKRFPTVTFIRCYMDPIMRKSGLTPDQRLRWGMYEPLPDCSPRTDAVTLLGSDFSHGEDSDLYRVLSENNIQLLQLPDCRSYEEYLKLSEGRLFLSAYPNGRTGAERTAKRLNRPLLYLSMPVGYREIRNATELLCQNLSVKCYDFTEEERLCDEVLESILTEIGDTPITIDYTMHPRPLGIARLLLEHGFNVRRVYLDVISGEEEADFLWLREHDPELELSPTVQVGMRVTERHESCLALGQKAAWFAGTAHFVNMVEGGGLWGYAGIRRLAELMLDAFLNEKDTEDLVPRKGLGCESCI